MLIFAISVQVVAFAFYSRSKKLKSLAIYAIIALAFGAVVPFAFLISWALMLTLRTKKVARNITRLTRNSMGTGNY